MYDFLHDRSKDHILIEMVHEKTFQDHMRLLALIKESYNNQGLTHSLKEMERDFDEYWTVRNRLQKEKGGKFKIKYVADVIPDNIWIKILETYKDLMYGPGTPGSKPLNEYPLEERLKMIEETTESILQWESEHKMVQ
jgi:hypothetical protein